MSHQNNNNNNNNNNRSTAAPVLLFHKNIKLIFQFSQLRFSWFIKFCKGQRLNNFIIYHPKHGNR